MKCNKSTYSHEQLLNFSNICNQRFVPKFMDSALLKPRLNPEWYTFGKVMMNWPGLWIT